MDPQGAGPKAKFSGIELDLRTGELVKDGRTLRLQRQSLCVLKTLLERSGQPVTREELHRQLWPEDTYVDFDQGLNKTIAKVRESLAALGLPQNLVETLPKLGYRFTVPVEWVSEPHASEVAANPPKATGVTPPRADFSQKKRRMIALAAVLVVIVAAVLFFARNTLFRSRAPIRSVAVLPIANLSDDPSEQYLADGITDELITDLSKIKSLRVISRTSVTRYKQTKLSFPQIAEQLQADAVVEGTMRVSNGRVRITLQLIAANPERHLWAAAFERGADDVLALQDQLALAAAEQIRAELTPEERTELSRHQPINPEAYREYLRGRYFLQQGWEGQTENAIPHLQHAIELDPAYAEAYAALGEAWTWEGMLGVDRRASTAKGIEFATRAINLDPNLAEGYSALGLSLREARRWKESESALRHALQLDPNLYQAQVYLASLMTMLGRKQESLAFSRQAADANPASAYYQREYAAMLFRAGRYDESIQQCKRVIELDPNYLITYVTLGNALAFQGRLREAAAAYQHREHENYSLQAWLAVLEHDPQRAHQLLRKADPGGDVWYPVALYMLGEKEAGLAELDRMVTERWVFLANFLKDDPLFDPMRGDPRFTAIVDKMGFEKN